MCDFPGEHSNTAFGKFRKKPLDQIQPTGAGGSVVNVVARMLSQPPPNLIDFVRTIVIHDQMNLQTTGNDLVDLVEETQELFLVHVFQFDLRGNCMARSSMEPTWCRRPITKMANSSLSNEVWRHRR
jgi:hypothetical protein